MNNLENMTVEQRADVINRFFRINRSTITIAKMKDGSKNYGFFESLDDAEELRKENKFRFVLTGESVAYRAAKDRQAKQAHTVIIDCNQLVDLRMVHANLSEEIEAEVPGLKEYLSGKTKMTYREHLTLLHKDSAEKMGLYINAESELSNVNGFFDKSLFDKTAAAKKKWQEAHNKYYNMLSFIKTNNIDIDSVL